MEGADQPGCRHIRPSVGLSLHPDPPANGTRNRRPARWPTRRGGLHPPGVASPVLLFRPALPSFPPKLRVFRAGAIDSVVDVSRRLGALACIGLASWTTAGCGGGG